MDFFENFQIVIQLFLSVLLGGWIGLEREYKRKEAGLRTYSLVCLGSCILTVISFQLFNRFSGQNGVSFDPSRIIQAIAVGIGFIGAGVIFKHSSFGPLGLTTAAGLWVTAAVGISIGAEMYFLAFCSTCLAVLILAGLRIIKGKVIDNNKAEE